jgi:hypothetical protein
MFSTRDSASARMEGSWDCDDESTIADIGIARRVRYALLAVGARRGERAARFGGGGADVGGARTAIP